MGRHCLYYYRRPVHRAGKLTMKPTMKLTMKKRIVISLGGSLIAPIAAPAHIDIPFLRSFRRLILSFVQRGCRFIICCGGGNSARTYQEAAKKANPKISDKDLDWVGTMATRVNAEIVRAIFSSHAYGHVACDPRKRIATEKRIIIAAGWRPGRSTDYDAAYLAKTYRAKSVLNLSNVSFVYDKDPKKHRGARSLRSLTWPEYRRISGSRWKPGANLPFDPIAAKLAQKQKITVHVLGRSLKNLQRHLSGKSFTGTTIQDAQPSS